MRKRWEVFAFAFSASAALAVAPSGALPVAPKPRGRDLGIPFPGQPGPMNAITDVPGVCLGVSTIVEDGVRTGVTAILPRGHDPIPRPVWAGFHALNGNGEMTGVHWINDVAGFRSDEAMAAVRAAPRHVRFVAMFSRTPNGRADRTDRDDTTLLAEVRAFFTERERAFAAAGVARERLVLDPGMGLFLSTRAAGSFVVLKAIASLRREHGPLLVSVSRKGFLRDVTGAPVSERGPATLAAGSVPIRHVPIWCAENSRCPPAPS